MTSARGWTCPATANAHGNSIDRARDLSAPTSFRRTCALSLSAAGRATRTELASYILAAVLISVPISLATSLMLPPDQHRMTGNVLAVLLAIPVPALIARRLHDQDRSGKWAWLAGIGFVMWLARTVLAATLGIDARLQFDRAVGLIDWAVILANLAIMLLLILPGTAGPNRFGVDPRGSE